MDDAGDGPQPVFLDSHHVFLIDGLPTGFTVGCDTASFRSTQPFRGFRDFPPGAHLIWVAPTESTSSRSGFWIFTPESDDGQAGHAHVVEWDKFNEVFRDPSDQAAAAPDPGRIELILPQLTPYDLRTADRESSHRRVSAQADGHPSDLLSDRNIWYQLTFAIRPELLDRITGQARGIWLVSTTDGVAGDTVSAEEARLYASRTSHLRFTFPMDTRLINPEATGPERTRQALDPTAWVIDRLESPGDDYRPEDLTGEFQFAFLAGMHLGNFSCLEQWFFLATQLVFRAYGLAVERPRQARGLVQTFHAQLLYNDRYLEGDVFELMPEHARRLRLALTTYRSRLDEELRVLGDACSPDQSAVGVAFSSLESWLLRLGWDLRAEYVRAGNVMLEDGEVVQAELSDFEDEDERGEFAPAVVEMENGREAGLLSWDA
ncbi:A1 cistron-splicing factor [Xylaria palmicola]|nr:A1 cistron-splicing factor [Xylaria palmicola]